jgi:hypothetical protein
MVNPKHLKSLVASSKNKIKGAPEDDNPAPEPVDGDDADDDENEDEQDKGGDDKKKYTVDELATELKDATDVLEDAADAYAEGSEDEPKAGLAKLKDVVDEECVDGLVSWAKGLEDENACHQLAEKLDVEDPDTLAEWFEAVKTHG